MLVNNRDRFLDSLRSIPANISLGKLVGLLLAGLLLGIVMTVSTGIMISRFQLPGSQYFVGNFIQNVPILLIFYWFLYRKEKVNLAALLFPRGIKNPTYISIAMFLILFVSTFVGLYGYATIGGGGNQNDISSLFEGRVDGNYLLFSGLSLIGYLLLAFMEELIFRFTIFRYLRAKGFVYAVVVSSIIFAVAHLNLGIPYAFLAGVVFAVNYEYTNSIVATTIIHAVGNYANFYYASYLVYMLMK